jgi:hypothetical protein
MFGGEEAEAETSASARKKVRIEGNSNTELSGNVRGSSEPNRVLWTEQAMYLRINQGFWVC